ncbi:MAG: electron transfer flavoprotein subunit alpha/FixB family protein [Eubacteriales bacterium]|nr:electron transfer flavoprotein subunit alpha/FixB family protein [Eubacteriales bacterium]
MAQGICIFAETYDGVLAPCFAELLQAAREIQKTTGEEISALVVGKNSQDICDQVAELGVDKILLYATEEDPLLQDDALAQVLADILAEVKPSAVLAPASPIGRSIFSRVAIRLNCGLTADCTELLVGSNPDGSHFIKHNKPSYGDNVYVTIVIREDFFPQILTLRPGVYEPATAEPGQAEIVTFTEPKLPASGVKVLSQEDKVAVTDSISSAERVVVCGKGMEAPESLELVKEFADKIGAALACTRPLSDVGLLPFERQIGQTGATIRPKLCISIGVSGAIQHTEGIKDTKCYIAINTDPQAAIFREAQTGIVADANDLLKVFLAK